MTTSGPYVRIVDVPGLGKTTRTWYRQKPVSSSPLPYTMAGIYRMAWSGPPDSASYTGWDTTTLSDGSVTPLKDQLHQKAYGRLMAEVSVASAQLGADIGERKQSISSLTTRVGQLTSAARALKRGNISAFTKALGIKKRTWRSAASDMGGVWLEYSFGWKPLVEDIYTAVQVIQRPWPNAVVRGKAQGYLSVVLNNNTAYSKVRTTYRWHLRRQLQTRISVSNWTAWKANELGLINPAAIAWELVPFSFVVDWFLPIGKYLQSLTDFLGLNLTDSFNTWYGVHDRKVDFYWYYVPNPNLYVRNDRRVDVIRGLSLPVAPKLRSRFTGFYSARGANAIALLSSQLKDLPSIAVSIPRKGRSLYV